jgi:DDE superfamily endonuclease
LAKCALYVVAILHRRKRLYACFYRALLCHRELKISSSDSSAVKQASTRYSMLECFLDRVGPLVSTFQTTFLRSRAEYYASKISAKSDNATQHCVGFIDGTLVEIARPSGMQQGATYSGHKRHPGLKWQLITTPDGLLFHIFGPFEGRRHYMHLYAESGPNEILSEGLLIDGVPHSVSVTRGIHFVHTS